jgi:hypothetical protein
MQNRFLPPASSQYVLRRASLIQSIRPLLRPSHPRRRRLSRRLCDRSRHTRTPRPPLPFPKHFFRLRTIHLGIHNCPSTSTAMRAVYLLKQHVCVHRRSHDSGIVRGALFKTTFASRLERRGARPAWIGDRLFCRSEAEPERWRDRFRRLVPMGDCSSKSAPPYPKSRNYDVLDDGRPGQHVGEPGLGSTPLSLAV